MSKYLWSGWGSKELKKSSLLSPAVLWFVSVSERKTQIEKKSCFTNEAVKADLRVTSAGPSQSIPFRDLVMNWNFTIGEFPCESGGLLFLPRTILDGLDTYWTICRKEGKPVFLGLFSPKYPIAGFIYAILPTEPD